MRRIITVFAVALLCVVLTGCGAINDLLGELGSISVFRDIEANAWAETLADAKNAVLVKDYERAADYFRELVETDSEDVDMRLWLGRCLLMTEEWEEAVEVLKGADEREPDNTDILKYLAKAYAAAGDNQSALDTYLKLQDIDPDSPAVYLGLEQLYIAMGDDEALAELYGMPIANSSANGADWDGEYEEGVSYDEFGNPVYNDEWPAFGPTNSNGVPWDDSTGAFEPEPTIDPFDIDESEDEDEDEPEPTPEPYDPNMPQEESEYGWDEFGG